MACRRDVRGTLNFLQRTELYDKVKPYSIDTEVRQWTGNVPRSNFHTNRVKEVSIADLRGREDQFTFERNGFAIIECPTLMEYEDYEDQSKLRNVYCQEMAACLIRYFNATSVQIFDLVVRRRDPEFPNVNIFKANMPLQPAARVHIDATRNSLGGLIENLSHEQADLRQKRYVYLNIWKPLRGPLFDWPLAFCDAATVDRKDLESHDQVFHDVARENLMLYHNPQQKWYYLSGQTPSEMLLIRQADSSDNIGVPHSAFHLDQHAENETEPNLLRESIEARILIVMD